jgi:hypothetical protein
MSNSSKQRSFIEKLISRLQGLGLRFQFDVHLEGGKHWKLVLTAGSNRKTVIISTTPRDRFSAQRAALGDVTRVLRELAPRAAEAFGSDGLLQMLSTDALSMSSPRIDPHQINRVLDGIDQDLLNGVQKHRLSRVIIGAASKQEDRPGNPDESFGVVLSPSANGREHQTHCSDLVVVEAAERPLYGNYFTLRQSLEALANYYQSCQGIVRLGVVVSDVWRPSDLRQFEVPLEFFMCRGINTLFFLASGSSFSMIRAPWD